MPSTTIRQRRRDDSGQALVEVVGTLPLAILAGGVVLQLFLVGYGAMRAESSARLAAREYSRGASESAVTTLVQQRASTFSPEVTLALGDLSAAGEEPGTGATGDPDAVSATVTLTVPFLGFGIDALDIKLTRHAVMPATG